MNSNITTIVFDLDGTLVQSHENIYKTTTFTFNKLNIKYNLPEAEFYGTLGLHFEDIFDQFDIIVNDFDEFMRVYKENYFNFIDASKLFPDVKTVLDELKSREMKIALLTTKGQGQADKIINHFKLTHNFDFIMGRQTGFAHKPAPDMLLHICNELHSKPEQTLMVGDTEMDILCGKNAGSKTCGVTYGYRTREDIVNLKPDFMIDKFSQVLDII